MPEVKLTNTEQNYKSDPESSETEQFFKTTGIGILPTTIGPDPAMSHCLQLVLISAEFTSRITAGHLQS